MTSVRRSNYIFENRVTFLGATRVGKSAIIEQVTKRMFLEHYSATVQNHVNHVIEAEGHVFICLIVDTCGDDSFPVMRQLAITKGNVFVIVYAIDSMKTFDRAKIQMREITQLKRDYFDEIKIILVGNKLDLYDKREVATQDGQSFCDEINLTNALIKAVFLETTAKDAASVERIFMKLTPTPSHDSHDDAGVAHAQAGAEMQEKKQAGSDSSRLADRKHSVGSGRLKNRNRSETSPKKSPSMSENRLLEDSKRNSYSDSELTASLKNMSPAMSPKFLSRDKKHRRACSQTSIAKPPTTCESPRVPPGSGTLSRRRFPFYRSMSATASASCGSPDGLKLRKNDTQQAANQHAASSRFWNRSLRRKRSSSSPTKISTPELISSSLSDHLRHHTADIVSIGSDNTSLGGGTSSDGSPSTSHHHHRRGSVDHRRPATKNSSPLRHETSASPPPFHRTSSCTSRTAATRSPPPPQGRSSRSGSATAEAIHQQVSTASRRDWNRHGRSGSQKERFFEEMEFRSRSELGYRTLNERTEYRSHSSNRVFAYFSSSDEMDSGVSDGLPSPPQSPDRVHREDSSEPSSPSCLPRGTSSPISLRRDTSSPPMLRRDASSPPILRMDSSSPPVLRSDVSSPSRVRRDTSSPTCLRREPANPSRLRREASSPARLPRDGSGSSTSPLFVDERQTTHAHDETTHAQSRSAAWRNELRKTSDTCLMKLQNVTQYFRKNSTT